jgi:hypothetical protein
MTEEDKKTINLVEIIKEAVASEVGKLRDEFKPTTQTTTLTENLTPRDNKEDEAKAFDLYKESILKVLQIPSSQGDFVYTGRTLGKSSEEDLKKANEQFSQQFESMFPTQFESIGALTGSNAVPEIWAKDVFRCCPYPASAFLNAPFVKWHTDIKGSPGDTVNVVTVGKATCGTAGCAEPSSTAPTIGKTQITLSEYQCSLYVCRNDLEDMVADTITEINNSLASCLDTCIDNHFIGVAMGLGSTLDKGLGTYDPNWIAEAIGTMRSGTCEPVALLIHPAVEANFMQDSQFVNAATFGDRSVITGGHIINYLGLDIIVLPLGSLIPTVGTYASLMLSRYAIHGAMKRDPTLESQYLVQTQRKYIYASVRLGCNVVCNDGVLWIRGLAS